MYGDPVELEGSTIVPVAVTWFGFGGGSGADPANPESKNEGGGGGGFAAPFGAYVTTNGNTRFKPNPVTLLVVSATVVSAVGGAVAQIIKACRR